MKSSMDGNNCGQMYVEQIDLAMLRFHVFARDFANNMVQMLS